MLRQGIVHDPETYAIIGAAMEVHRELSAGFPEAPYREALLLELTERNIPTECEVRLPIVYKGKQLKTHYRADFVCYGGILVEAKALRELTGAEESQLLTYIKASKLGRGLLLNFGTRSLECRRFVSADYRGSVKSV